MDDCVAQFVKSAETNLKALRDPTVEESEKVRLRPNTKMTQTMMVGTDGECERRGFKTLTYSSIWITWGARIHIAWTTAGRELEWVGQFFYYYY